MIDLDVVARATVCFEPLPTSLTRLAALAVDESPDLAQIVEIVRYDQALTAGLLRSANSSWSAARTEITTVRDAVIRLGAGPVMALALGVKVRTRLEAAVPAYDLAEGELWNHSVIAMLAAETLAPQTGRRLPAETATAALLHDVGKLVLTRIVDGTDLAAIGAARGRGLSRVQAEREVLGLDHAALGATIARAWGLPASLVTGIGAHHAPARADTEDPAAGLLAYGVGLADAVAKTIAAAAGGAPDDNADPQTRAEAADVLGVSSAGFDDVCGIVTDRFAEVSARFT